MTIRTCKIEKKNKEKEEQNKETTPHTQAKGRTKEKNAYPQADINEQKEPTE
nr:hypothetical protein [uncultured Alloprevotella sp.]